MLDEIVVETFREYLGAHDDLPASSRLLDDLGIDSVILVAILVDLAGHLDLDLSMVGTSLKNVQTLEDVVSLVNAAAAPPA